MKLQILQAALNVMTYVWTLVYTGILWLQGEHWIVGSGYFKQKGSFLERYQEHREPTGRLEKQGYFTGRHPGSCRDYRVTAVGMKWQQKQLFLVSLISLAILNLYHSIQDLNFMEGASSLGYVPSC